LAIDVLPYRVQGERLAHFAVRRVGSINAA